MTTPVYRILKQQIVTAEVHLLTKKKFSEVTKYNPYISKFHYFNNNLEEIIEDLKKEDFDYVIDLQNNLRTLKIKKALKKTTSVVDKLNIQKFLLTKFKIRTGRFRHFTERCIDSLKPFNLKDDGKGLDYFISEEQKIAIEDLPATHHAGYVCFVIGANYSVKRLPEDKLIELCNIVDHPIVLLGGDEVFETAEKIAASDPYKIYNVCGRKFSLNESADIIRRSKLVVSNDTGFQYVACAYKKPVIAVWGATTPEIGVGPYYGKISAEVISDNVIVQPKLWCQPCTKFGYHKCPLSHFKCMKNQDVELIKEKILKRLNQKLVRE